MAIVTDSEILDYLQVEEGEESDLIEAIHLSAEKMIKKYCNRDFEVTSYRERYDGNADNKIVLRQYPVTAITRLSLWPLDVIRVKNSGSTTNATISCSSTGVTLTKDGTSVTKTFALYPTFSTLAAAIDAVSGWDADVVSPEYNDFKSTELIERMGLYCLQNNWAYLQMPYQRGELDFDIDSENGIIYLFRYYVTDYYDKEMTGFPRGTRNIFVDYIAGYTDMPDDIILAVKILTKYLYARTQEESFGFTNYRLGDITGTFESQPLPLHVKMILDSYRKRVISCL